MASATKYGSPYMLTMTLSKDEAEVLLFILDRIGGKYSGPRGHSAAISSALYGADVELVGFPVRDDESHITFTA